MIIMKPSYKSWLGILASIFLGVTFIVAGSSKVFTPVVESELPKILFAILMIIELIIGLLLVAGIFVQVVAIFSLSLIAGFITSNILEKVQGQEECLSCFGAMGTLSTTQALYLDGIMMALAITILFFYPGRFFNTRPWYWGK